MLNKQNSTYAKLVKSLASKLTSKEILRLDELIEGEIIVPIDIAAKLKGVSEKSIYHAINTGKLLQVNGVTLRSLGEYKVSEVRKMVGKLGAIARAEALKKAIKKGKIGVVIGEMGEEAEWEKLMKLVSKAKEEKLAKEALEGDKEEQEARKIVYGSYYQQDCKVCKLPGGACEGHPFDEVEKPSEPLGALEEAPDLIAPTEA